MTSPLDHSEREALDWVIRLRHAGTDDWLAFDAWLSGDPAREQLYWRLAAADADIGDALATRSHDAAVILVVPKRRNWWFPVLAVAATLVASVGTRWVFVPLADGQHSRPFALETKRGEVREFVLKDGTRIDLNGDTRIELDRSDPRNLRLARGEARLNVVHDDGHPLSVKVGDATLRDVGTVFGVSFDAGVMRVAVAEGAVLLTTQGTSGRLNAGDALTRDASGEIRTSRLDPRDVGAWHERRLTYDETPLVLVAADLARSTGTTVAVDPAITSLRFSGGLRLTADPEETITRAADLIGVRAQHKGLDWQFSKR